MELHRKNRIWHIVFSYFLLKSSEVFRSTETLHVFLLLHILCRGQSRNDHIWSHALVQGKICSQIISAYLWSVMKISVVSFIFTDWSKGHWAPLCTDISLLQTGTYTEIKRQSKAYVKAELGPLLVHILSLLKRNICSTFVLLSFPWLSVRTFGFCTMKQGHVVTLPWQLSPSLPLSGIYNPNYSCYVNKYCLSLNYFIFITTTFECYYSNISGFPCQETVTDSCHRQFYKPFMQLRCKENGAFILPLCLPVNKKDILNG